MARKASITSVPSTPSTEPGVDAEVTITARAGPEDTPVSDLPLPVSTPPEPLEGFNPFGGAFYPEPGQRVDLAMTGAFKGLLTRLARKSAPLVLDRVDEAAAKVDADKALAVTQPPGTAPVDPATQAAATQAAQQAAQRAAATAALEQRSPALIPSQAAQEAAQRAAANAATATTAELERLTRLRSGASPLVESARSAVLAKQDDILARAGQPATDLPTYAVNINLDNLNDPQGVNQLIMDVADSMPVQVDEARRGVRSNAETVAAAHELFQRDEGFMLDRTVGQAFNAEQITATRFVLATQRDKVATLAQAVLSGKNDSATLLDFRKALSQLGAVQLQLHGMAAEAGRALQAFRVPAQPGVMGMGTEAAAMTAKDLTALVDAHGGPAGVTDLAKAFLDLETPAAQNAMARESTRRGAADMLHELWYNFVLSGPATHMRNIVGNGMTMTLSTTERAVAAQWGKLFGFVGMKQGVRAGEAEAMVRAYWGALGDAWRLANFAFRHNESVGRQTGYKLPLSMREIWTMGPDRVQQLAAKDATAATSAAKVVAPKGPAITGENVLGLASDTANKVSRKLVGRDVMDPSKLGERGALGRMTDLLSATIDVAGGALRTPTRALGAEDQFFKTLAFRGEATARLWRDATAAGYSGVKRRDYVNEGLNFLTPTEEAAAEKFARVVTMSEAIQSEYALGFMKIGAAPLGNLFAPFVKVATNILDYSTQRVLFPARPQWWREVASSEPAVRDLAMAKASTGALAWMTAFAAASDGAEVDSDAPVVVTGAGPQDPDRRAIWMQRGYRPYSIRVGGKGGRWVQYSRLDPAGQMLGIAADSVLMLAQSDEVTGTEFGAVLVAGVGNNIVNKSFMSAMSDGMEVFTSRDPEQYVRWAQRSMASYVVPNAITQLTQSQEPYLRKAVGVMEEIQRRASPKGARALPAVRDLAGQPKEMSFLFGTVFSGVAAEDDKPDPVADEIWRLGMAFSRPNKIIDGVELTEHQYDRYQQLVGYALKQPAGAQYAGPAVRIGERRTRVRLNLAGKGLWEALTELVKTTEYKHGTDGGDPPGQKAQMIADLRRLYLEDARTRLLGEFPELVDKVVEDEVKTAAADGMNEDYQERVRSKHRLTLQRRIDQVKSYEVAE